MDQRDPVLSIDAGQSSELQNSERFPTEFAQGTWALSADEPVGDRRSLGEVVRRSGNDQSTAFGDPSAQQLEQRVSDARIGDARGSQKKPHDPSRQSDRVSGGVPENIAEVILSSLDYGGSRARWRGSVSGIPNCRLVGEPDYESGRFTR